MANRNHNRGRPAQPSRRAAPRPGAPDFKEPEVRRWPHPVGETLAPRNQNQDPALHYIRCALSYQNQLLADIKALLEQVVVNQTPEEEK